MKPVEWAATLAKQFPKAFSGARRSSDLDAATFPCVEMSAANAVEVLQFCSESAELSCDYLECITCVDTGQELEIIYQTFSTSKGHRVNVRATLSRQEAKIASACPVWRAALSYEREIAEMFGVEFAGHPEPRHLLLPDSWRGFPLRKDYIFPETVGAVEHRRELLRKEHVRP